MVSLELYFVFELTNHSLSRRIGRSYSLSSPSPSTSPTPSSPNPPDHPSACLTCNREGHGSVPHFRGARSPSVESVASALEADRHDAGVDGLAMIPQLRIRGEVQGAVNASPDAPMSALVRDVVSFDVEAAGAVLASVPSPLVLYSDSESSGKGELWFFLDRPRRSGWNGSGGRIRPCWSGTARCARTSWSRCVRGDCWDLSVSQVAGFHSDKILWGCGLNVSSLGIWQGDVIYVCPCSFWSPFGVIE